MSAARDKLPDLIRIACAVRRSLEDLFPRRKDLKNLCSLSACAITIIAKQRRIPADFMGGLYHFTAPIDRPQFGNSEHIQASRSFVKPVPHAWVHYRRNYIDATLTQFEEHANPVAVLSATDQRLIGCAEPIEFVKLALPVCGSDEGELKRVVNGALKLLSAIRAKQEVPEA